MKNLGKLLVGCAVSCSIMAGPVNATSPCGGSGLTIGAGFKLGKSQYELQNNKIKPANERFAEMVREKLAPEKIQATNDQRVVDQAPVNYQDTGSVVANTDDAKIWGYKQTAVVQGNLNPRTESVSLAGYTYVKHGKASLVGIKGPGGYMDDAGFLLPHSASESVLRSGVRFQGALTYNDPEDCNYQNAPADHGKSVFTLHKMTREHWTDRVIAKYSNLGVNLVVGLRLPGNGDKQDLTNYLVAVNHDDNGDQPLANAPAFPVGEVARQETVGIDGIPEGSVYYYDVADIMVDREYPVFGKILHLFYNDVAKKYRLGGLVGNGRIVYYLERLPDAVALGESTMIKNFNSNHEAFSKSNIGRNFEKGAHWDGAIDLNLGWTQRFGDFSFYLGGIFEIPCIKKEYQIKDKALADLKTTNSNNSSNDDKNKKDETNKLGYTFEKKLSFGASLMGYYNVTRMVSIGAGVNIWKKRGEFKYNNTAELYLVNEGSNNAKLIEACGVKVDEFNADAKKAGYGEKSKNVSAWMFEPVVGINWFIKNFNISLKFGYMLGKKFMKDNFELSGKGMTFSVNLSYTIPMF